MPSGFERAVLDLANSVGGDAMQAVSDEHARWELYLRGLSLRGHHLATLRALRDDPNSPLVSAVVVRALEMVPSAERTAWLDVLPPGRQRDFAQHRAIELELLQHLVDDDLDAEDLKIESWSHWLQLQAADRVSSRRVLDVLSARGDTKRIRNRARERLGST